MAPPEFSPKLDWSQAQEYRRGEAHALSNARNSGLGEDAREYRDVLHYDPLYQQGQTLTMQHRWEKLAQKIPEFSEEDWERAGRVFSGINNGVKAALFIDIAQNTKPGMYMPIKDIVSRFKELFAGTELLEVFEEGKKTRRSVIAYCQRSLCDVGVLTAGYSLDGELIGFGVTKDGVDSGLPHALRLLTWENTMHESAYPILGQTNSRGETRAPLNTAKILEYLLRHPYNAREVDLIDVSGVAGSIASKALERFHALGIVDYKGVTTQTSRISLEYAWDNADLGQARYIRTSHGLQDSVITAIEQKGLSNLNPTFSIEDIFQGLPEKIRDRWGEKSLRHEISSILSGLASPRYGLLQRVDDFKGHEKLSNIALTQKGRSFVLHIILPALLNSSAQPLRASLSQLAQTSAELYYPYSQSNKMREQQNNIHRLVQALGESSIPQVARELAAKVGLSSGRINQIIRPHIEGSSEVMLEVNGQSVIIERTKEKGVWYYSLKNPSGE